MKVLHTTAFILLCFFSKTISMSLHDSIQQQLSTVNSSELMSNLFYNGFDYQVELYLGDISEANQGNFTIDSGSANFIVNGAGCNENLCTDYKQFTPPPSADKTSQTFSISYGDGSGYKGDVYNGKATFPSGVSVTTPICYNNDATPNPSTGKTDNFNEHAQGIIGLAYDCISSREPTSSPVLETITESIVSNGLSEEDGFAACLNKHHDSKIVFGVGVPEGMARATVDPTCGFYSPQYNRFEISINGKYIDTVNASAPVKSLDSFSVQCGGNEESVCNDLPVIDTGTTGWVLTKAHADNLISMIYDAYEQIDPSMATLIQEALKSPNEINVEVINFINKNPMSMKIIFEGENNPYITATLTEEVIQYFQISENNILGQTIINGNIIHFDKTNNFLAFESISEKGCDFADMDGPDSSSSTFQILPFQILFYSCLFYNFFILI